MIRRLAYVNKVGFPSPMPSTVFSAMNAWGFTASGVESHLVCRPGRGGPEEGLEGLGLSGEPLLHVHRLSARIGGATTNEVFYARAVRLLLGLHGEAGLDAVITRDPGFLPYLVYLRLRLDVPVFYQSHNFYMSLRGREEMNRVHRRWFHLSERLFLPEVDGVLALQSAQAALYREELAVPVMVAWPGVRSRAPELPDRGDGGERVVCYAGSFQPMKGIDAAVESFRMAARPGWRLLLLGGRNAEEVSYARDLVRGAGLEERAEVTGWLPYRELTGRLRQADVGLLLLRDNFYNRYLTAPSKLFDYLAAGLPVVTVDLPSLSDFVTGGREALVTSGSPESVAGALGRLMEDRRLAREMGEAALERAGDLLWERSAGRMLSLMEGAART